MTKRFVPPFPPRPVKPVATWRGFFGERARTSVYGWSQRAFEIDYLKRDILGFRVHILLEPDLIEHASNGLSVKRHLRAAQRRLPWGNNQGK